MRVLLLGARRGLNENNWKDGLADAGERLGWDVLHVNARGIHQDEVLRLAKECDVLIWARTHGHDPTGDDLAGMLRRIEDAGVRTVALHLDLYWGIARREDQIGRHPWWSCQSVWTADGGPRDWVGRGVNHYWCPPAMDSRFLGRGRFRKEYRHGAVFVGSAIPDIHGPHRRMLLAWGRTWARQRGGFQHYGSGQGVWGTALSDLYASTSVVLGDSAPAPYYWSDRVPITLGRGGLLAHPETPGLAEQGFTGDHLVLYRRGHFRQLALQLEDIGPGRWREMTEAALTLIEERHLWKHRLRQIAETILG